MRWNHSYMPLFTIGVKLLRAISYSPKQYGEPHLLGKLRKLLAIYTFCNIRGLQIEVHGIDVTFTNFLVICMFLSSQKMIINFGVYLTEISIIKCWKIIKKINKTFTSLILKNNAFSITCFKYWSKTQLIIYFRVLSEFIFIDGCTWRSSERKILRLQILQIFCIFIKKYDIK